VAAKVAPEKRPIERKIIAGFEIIEKVGTGGMGEVFKARQLSMDRIVALKILLPKFAKNENFKERFSREAHFSAKLNHPNIVNGFLFGEEGENVYFAMEFVDGRTIKQVLREKGCLPFKEACSVLRQMAEALSYIGRNKLIHRDIKPDNIMLDRNGHAKLCDLGLAKLAHYSETMEMDEGPTTDADGTAPSLTHAGHIAGTPNYISPEVARLEPRIDARADIYGLGATFYHFVTGRPLFEERSSKAVMKRHVHDEAPSLCDAKKGVPESWGCIAAKMLAKSPNDRYRNADELLEDIAAAEAGHTVRAVNFSAKSSVAMPKGRKKGSGVIKAVAPAPKPSGVVKAASARLPRPSAVVKVAPTAKPKPRSVAMQPIDPAKRAQRLTASRKEGRVVGIIIGLGGAAFAFFLSMLFSGGHTTGIVVGVVLAAITYFIASEIVIASVKGSAARPPQDDENIETVSESAT
jgi:serine/threonine-protein kinase